MSEKNLPDLDRLLHSAMYYPYINARLGSLDFLLRVAEQQLEVGKNSELKKVLREHELLGRQLHPEDREYELKNLEIQCTHFLPKLFRGGYLLTLWSVMERSLMDVVARASKHTGVAIPSDYFRQGSFLPAVEDAIRACAGVSILGLKAEKESLGILKDVRQTL